MMNDVCLYKRNNQGTPIRWNIKLDDNGVLTVKHGIVGKPGHIESFNTTQKNPVNEFVSRIKEKRKEGYKALEDLYDNAPKMIVDEALYNYLDTYLPKFNVSIDGRILPMLAKTLEDETPFNKFGTLDAQWKINGVRCIIGAEKKVGDLFSSVKLTYQSREGIVWDLSELDDNILPNIDSETLDLMIEEGVHLDGELYLPGYTVNDINSMVKNKDNPFHSFLQFWLYDICVENWSSINRRKYIENHFDNYMIEFTNKDNHLNNKNSLIALPTFECSGFHQALELRDQFIDIGFEGLILRNPNNEYAFGKRNQSMFKFKKKLDGKFTIVNINADKRGCARFVCMNDINDELFECTINESIERQQFYYINREIYKGKTMFVEYRERSGVKEVPFHAKGICIID